MLLMGADVYIKEPFDIRNGIPVFSKLNKYIDNYEKISQEHIESIQKNELNPWMSEDLWIEFEESTLKHAVKYVKKNDMILDIGIGTGRLMSHLFQHTANIYGMDISTSYLQVAREKGVDVCYSLIEDMPYKQNLFDVVFCTDVLEHVLDLNLAVTKILSVLKKGGVLIIRVPYRENLVTYASLECKYEYCHLRNFDENTIALLFRKIFECEVHETSMAGYEPGNQKYPFRSRIIRGLIRYFITFIKSVNNSVYMKLFSIFYYPLVMNVVIRKNY